MCLYMEMQIMTAFAFPAVAFQTETICATNCLHSSNNRKPISANTFPSPNATVGFGCFKRQREKKKNLIDNGLSSTLFSLGAASIRCEDIFSPVRLLQVRDYGCSLEASIGRFGPHEREPFVVKVVRISGNCSMEDAVHIVSYLKQALMLIGPKFSCWCSSEISHVMRQKKVHSR